jgi:GNAT superfamily N-acetyltransferase
MKTLLKLKITAALLMLAHALPVHSLPSLMNSLKGYFSTQQPTPAKAQYTPTPYDAQVIRTYPDKNITVAMEPSRNVKDFTRIQLIDGNVYTDEHGITYGNEIGQAYVDGNATIDKESLIYDILDRSKTITPSRHQLFGLTIHPKYRQNGYGKLLYNEAVFNYGKSRGFGKMGWYADPHSLDGEENRLETPDLVKFYEKQGAKRVGTTKIKTGKTYTDIDYFEIDLTTKDKR